MKPSIQRPGVLSLLLLVAAGSALLAVAQQPPPSEQPQGPIKPKPPEQEPPYALRVDVPVVNVDVSVVDNKGGFIAGLRKEHFRVYSDGVEQEVVAFAPTEASLTTVLVVESRSTYLLYDNLDAAYIFLNQLKKDDWTALVAYDLRPRVEVDFTHDRREIVQALRQLQYGGGFNESNVFDAIVDTLDRVKDVEGKKSIIVIGTMLDTFSRHTFDETRKIVRQHGTTIFVIGTAWPWVLAAERAETSLSNIRRQAGSELRLNIQLAEAQARDLAEQTGGFARFIRFQGELPNLYREIAVNLRNQYSLAFQPKNYKRDGKFHKIEVKLIAPDGTPVKVIDQNQKEIKYTIHARKGYYAPES